MNPGILAIFTLLGTVGAGVVIMFYRDLIFDAPPPARRRLAGRRPVRRRQATTRPKPIETPREINAIISQAVSGIAMPGETAETVALRVILKLVAAKLVTETIALETVFNVKAGSKKRYVELRDKFKQLQSELDKAAEPELLPSRNR